MKVLGISAFYHDSAAALVIDGHVIAAASEERFTRIKNDPSFPDHAIRFILKASNISLSEVDAVIFYDKPLIKFERLLDTYHSFAPRGLKSFLQSIPVWIKDKIFQRKIINDFLLKIADGELPPLYFSEHHLSHAASAFYPSPYNSAAFLTLDGVGEWATSSYGTATRDSGITILGEQHFPHSLGLLYSSFTTFLGFKVNSGEYKLMGLAPYGNPESPDISRYKDLIKDKLVSIKHDGSIALNMSYFEYATSTSMFHKKKWTELFGFGPRAPESELEQNHMNLALAIQQICDEIVLKLATHVKRETQLNNLVMAGGVALNCVSIGKLSEAKIFDNVWVQPAAGDAGGALGAALAYSSTIESIPEVQHFSPYLGPEFSKPDLENEIRHHHLSYNYLEDNELFSETANSISEGKIIGWFQGKMEWGPRALGNRSILADPRLASTQKTLNLKIKKREGFRPFAPSVISEEFDQYFDNSIMSPYMSLIGKIKLEHCHDLPVDYHKKELLEKLYFERSSVPAITHIDYSARPQVIFKEINPRFHQLVSQFYQLTGCPMLVNTSFNVRGEPIVCSPKDAINCFLSTEMDILILGNFWIEK